MGVCVSTPIVDDGSSKPAMKSMPLTANKNKTLATNLSTKERISSPSSATHKRQVELAELEKMRTLSSYSANHSANNYSTKAQAGEDGTRPSTRNSLVVSRPTETTDGTEPYRPRNPYINQAISPFMITPTSAAGMKDPNFVTALSSSRDSPLNGPPRKTSLAAGEINNVLLINNADPNQFPSLSPSRLSHFLRLKNLSTGAAVGENGENSTTGAISPGGEKSVTDKLNNNDNTPTPISEKPHQHAEPKISDDEEGKPNENGMTKNDSSRPNNTHEKTRIFQEEKIKAHKSSALEETDKHSPTEDKPQQNGTFKKSISSDDANKLNANGENNPTSPDGEQRPPAREKPPLVGGNPEDPDYEKQFEKDGINEMSADDVAKNKELYYRYLRKLQKEKFAKIQFWLDETILDELSPNPIQNLHPPKNAE